MINVLFPTLVRMSERLSQGDTKEFCDRNSMTAFQLSINFVIFLVISGKGFVEPDHVIIIEGHKIEDFRSAQGTARITVSNLFKKRAFAVVSAFHF